MDEVIFNIMAVIAILFAVFFISIIVYNIVNRKKTVKHAPQLSVTARVVSRRTDTWGDHATTSYYATFEVESGDRIELSMSGTEYGMLAEGDSGTLTFKGTDFISFTRA
ncbi:MAG: DUF2500 domain-containing protein [Oscillospiraceae bacterium]|nr:DUF2500 domain-containing protein [Oscillospiraceae bacterium]